MSPFSLIVPDPLLRTNCVLGEGPLWDPRTQTLHFIDIDERKLYHYHPESGDLKVDQFDEKIGCLVLRQNGGLACSAQRGFAIIENDVETGKPVLRYLAQPLSPTDAPHIRFNDGACDSRGRFFAGTVHSDDPPIAGSLWKYADGKATLVDDNGITDGNGIGWSADDKTLYFTNSLVNEIYAYDYDIDTGKVSNRRLHIDTSAHGLGSDTFPDGFCIDSEGGIWTAQWGGSRIARFAPDGTYDLEISLPTALNVTACCFGGPDLDQLYITTASALCLGGDAALQEEYFDSGNVFVCDLKGKFQEGTYRHYFLG